MNLSIPDTVLRQANISEADFKLELAVFLYEKKILTLGKASEFAGIPRLIFQQELGKRGLYISYDEEEFEKDLATIAEKYGKS